MSENTDRLRGHVASYKSMSPHRQNCLDVCDEADQPRDLTKVGWGPSLDAANHDKSLLQARVKELERFIIAEGECHLSHTEFERQIELLRKELCHVCEYMEDEAYGKLSNKELTEHEKGYFRGQKKTAKSIRSGMGCVFEGLKVSDNEQLSETDE